MASTSRHKHLIVRVGTDSLIPRRAQPHLADHLSVEIFKGATRLLLPTVVITKLSIVLLVDSDSILICLPVKSLLKTI